MNITEVRVKLMHHRTDRLRAFCSVTIDNDFVVHDLRVIEGRKGLFVAMPSRKLSDNCPRCGGKNDLRAKHCSECGTRLEDDRGPRVPAGRDKYHVDVAHPINTPCREMLRKTVLSAYEEEEKRAAAGLPPLHEYTPTGLEEFASEYVEVDEAEGAAVGLREPEARQPEAPAPAEEPLEAPVPAQPREPAAREEEPEQPEPEQAVVEDRRPRRARREPESGGFGHGVL